ncbi:MAG: hypothetical protein QHH06_09470 [Clostridiales bacterium]|jgi:hypothetical protein|nr:hypothetical protein [Eubacteriales bacterium]MDH7566694.1 hypothetical protein [Clostridiales bacterium]
MIRIPFGIVEEKNIVNGIIYLEGWQYKILAFDKKTKDYIVSLMGKCA